MEAAMFECLNYFHYKPCYLFFHGLFGRNTQSIASIRIEIRATEADLEAAEAARRLQYPNVGIIFII